MTHKNRILGSALLLFVALLVIYSNHWHNSFHFDDFHTIENNVYVQRLDNIPLFFMDCKTFSSLSVNRVYRPIVTTTLAIDYALAQKFTGDGLDTLWYHISIFFFFILQGGLIYLFCRKIVEPFCDATTRDWISFLVTALYMIHPAQAETVNYIIAMSDSLSTFFLLLGFVIYQYYPAKRKYFLYLIPMIVGGLTKPTTLMFAPMLLMYQILFEEKRGLTDTKWIRWSLLKRGFVASLLVGAAVYFFAQRMAAPYWQPGGVALFNYAITQPYVMLHYVTNFIFPLHFSADTDWQAFEKITDSRCIFGFLFLAALIAAIIYSSRSAKWRPVSFGLGFFLLALIPTSVVPLAEVTNDHRVFFPYVGLALAVVWFVYLISQTALKRVSATGLAIAIALILAAYGFRTHERNAVWQTEETLWKDVTIESPLNVRGLMNYGYAFMRRNSLDTANIYFKRGLELRPNYSILNWNMAVLKSRMGDNISAETFYKNAMRLDPGQAGIYSDYAIFLRQQGKKDESIVSLEKSLEMVDANIGARHILMELLIETSRFEELKKVAARTLELVPGDPESLHALEIAKTGKSMLQLAEEKSPTYTTPEQWLNLSLMYYQAGKFEQCITAAQAAIKLKPEYAEAWSNICASYNSLGRFADGKKAGEEAVRIAPNNALAKGNLNWSLTSLKKAQE